MTRVLTACGVMVLGQRDATGGGLTMVTPPSQKKENNFIKDFPQLADGLLVIPLPVEEQCRGVLSEPRPDLQLLTGDVRYNEAMGYPMMQQWRVRSNLYKVKLNSITLAAGPLTAWGISLRVVISVICTVLCILSPI
ncbi:hypothetical protein FKM82_028449 [Ascaphus truei]